MLSTAGIRVNPTVSSEEAGTQGPALRRTIGRWGLTALVLNSIIGSSIFVLPATLAGKLGGMSPIAWAVAAVGIGVTVACFAEVSSRFSEAGGPYLFAREAFGPFVGIQTGWVSYLMRLASNATNCNVLVIYLGEFWPTLRPGPEAAIVMAIVLGLLAVVNYRGVTGGANLGAGFAVAKTLPLMVFVAAGGAVLLARGSIHPSAAPPASIGTWAEALLLLVFAYGGFEGVTAMQAEAKNPRRDIAFALLVPLMLVATVCILVQVVVLHALSNPGAEARPLAAAAQVLFGSWGGRSMAIAAFIAIIGLLAGGMVYAPRFTYAMGTRGDFPRFFAYVHPRFRTPTVSIVVFAVLAWLLAISGGFLQNLTIGAVSRLLVYGSVCASLPVFRHRESHDPNFPRAEFRLPGGTLFAALGVGFAVVLLTRMSARDLVVLLVTIGIAAVNWWVVARTRRRQPRSS